MENNFNIPILLLIFNRPDTTQIVFNEIKKIRPSSLFIAGDGPRSEDEYRKIKETRNITNQIDWECKFETLFRNKNLGCKMAVSSALNWFFRNNEMGIILEDDCVPHPSFFNFCSELLIKYRDEKKIMQISGFNALKKVQIKESYYFAKFGPIWGWATWSRAWKHYDVQMISWQRFKVSKSYKHFCDSKYEERWRVKTYDKVANGLIDTWDYQWSFAKLKNSGLSIIPSRNLIRNIGFGENATHTSGNYMHSKIDFEKGLNFPLIHPDSIRRNKQLDKKFFNNFVLKNKFFGTLNKLFGNRIVNS